MLIQFIRLPEWAGSCWWSFLRSTPEVLVLPHYIAPGEISMFVVNLFLCVEKLLNCI